MAVKDENSLVLQQLKHPQDAETSEEKKIRYRLEWAIKKFLSFYSTLFREIFFIEIRNQLLQMDLIVNLPSYHSNRLTGP